MCAWVCLCFKKSVHACMGVCVHVRMCACVHVCSSLHNDTVFNTKLHMCTVGLG